MGAVKEEVTSLCQTPTTRHCGGNLKQFSTRLILTLPSGVLNPILQMRKLRPSIVKRTQEQGWTLSFWFFPFPLLRVLTSFFAAYKPLRWSAPASELFCCPPHRGWSFWGPRRQAGPGTKMAHTKSGLGAGSGKNLAAAPFLAWLASFNLPTLLPLHSSSPQLCAQLHSPSIYRLLGQRRHLRPTLTMSVTEFMENRESLSFTSIWQHRHLLSSAVMISWALSPPPGQALFSFFLLFSTHYSTFLSLCAQFVTKYSWPPLNHWADIYVCEYSSDLDSWILPQF